jgi:hypothetical protein
MFKKLAVGISLAILLAVNPTAIGENNSFNYRSNLFEKSNKKAS